MRSVGLERELAGDLGRRAPEVRGDHRRVAADVRPASPGR